MEIGSIGSSPNERKSTSVVYLVVSAAQNGQFDWFERFCDLLPNLRSFVINNFCYQTSESLPSLCLSRYYNLLICKRVARHSTHSCNIHKVSAPDISFFSFFFLAAKIFFMATILQLKVAKRRLFEKVSLERWWCQDLDRAHIKLELGISSNTAVDWDIFCWETCEVTLENQREKFGGKGKVVQIDESKFGKRKYHCSHRVEGQWVFGGIEDSTRTRKSFLVVVDKRQKDSITCHYQSSCLYPFFNFRILESIH